MQIITYPRAREHAIDAVPGCARGRWSDAGEFAAIRDEDTRRAETRISCAASAVRKAAAAGIRPRRTRPTFNTTRAPARKSRTCRSCLSPWRGEDTRPAARAPCVPRRGLEKPPSATRLKSGNSGGGRLRLPASIEGRGERRRGVPDRKTACGPPPPWKSAAAVALGCGHSENRASNVRAPHGLPCWRQRSNLLRPRT